MNMIWINMAVRKRYTVGLLMIGFFGVGSLAMCAEISLQSDSRLIEPASELLLLKTVFENHPAFTAPGGRQLAGSFVAQAKMSDDEQAGAVLDLTARIEPGTTGSAAVWVNHPDVRASLNGLESFTLTFWVNGCGSTRIPWRDCTWLNLGGQAVWLNAYPDGRLRVKVNGQFVGLSEGSIRLPADGWYFVAVTYDAKAAENQAGCRIYLWSPEEDRSGTMNLRPLAMVAKYMPVRAGMVKAKNPLVLGADTVNGNNGAVGQLSEMRWYGSHSDSYGALSCQELRWVMQASAPAGVLDAPAPSPDPGSEWLFFADSMDKVLPSVTNWSERSAATNVDLLMARDESESFQLVVVAREHTLNASLEVSTICLDSGEELSVNIYSVGYAQCGPSERAYPVAASGLWPDPLLPFSPAKIPAGETRCWWLTVDTSSETLPGVYSGSIRVSSECGERIIPLEINVLPVTLPRPGNFGCHIGLYWPQVAGWYFDDQEYLGSVPLEMLVEWARFLGKYRITPKNIGYEYRNVSIGEEPLPSLGDNLGRLLMDREDSDQVRVDLSETVRVIRSLEPWPDYTLSSFRLPPFDEFLLDKKNPKSEADPERSKPEKVVRPVSAFLQAWKEAGLPEKSYLYGIDEPRAFQLPMVRQIYTALRQQSPQTKILQVISYGNPQDLDGLVDIWCPITPMLRKESDFFREQVAQGRTLWAYVCCWPSFPYGNLFIDRPGIETCLLPLQLVNEGASGLLYWACNYWGSQQERLFPEKPFLFDFNNVSGDGTLIYPGPNKTPWPSIRLEQLRDGLEDAEAVLLLRRLLIQARSAGLSELELSAVSRLADIPDEVSRNLIEGTENPSVLQAYRRKLLSGIDWLQNRMSSCQ